MLVLSRRRGSSGASARR
ncbi:hypothetical protein [Rhodococcoides fascians]